MKKEKLQQTPQKYKQENWILLLLYREYSDVVISVSSKECVWDRERDKDRDGGWGEVLAQNKIKKCTVPLEINNNKLGSLQILF